MCVHIVNPSDVGNSLFSYLSIYDGVPPVETAVRSLSIVADSLVLLLTWQATSNSYKPSKTAVITLSLTHRLQRDGEIWFSTMTIGR